MENKKNKTCTLSLCMIVKNEEKYLDDCLKSVKDAVQQIVIIDTGSTDGTVEIAKKYKAEVHHFKWIDDFSAARNESIKYTSGDWILWIDADERLKPDSISKLKKLLKPEKKAVAYIIQIHNFMQDKSDIKISSAHRLFNNHKGIYFSGRIHEQITPSVSSLKGEERQSDVVLEHLGYGLDDESQNKKNLRNSKLLERMVKESPGSAYPHFTLAQHYGLTGEPQKAVKHYETAYKQKQFDAPMTASLLNTMAEAYVTLKNFSRANELCLRSVRMIPMQVGGYYMLYKSAAEQNKNEEVLKWLKTLHEKNFQMKITAKSISTDVLISEDKILYSMGSLHLKSGDMDKALSCFEKVYQSMTDNAGLLEKMAVISIQKGYYEKAEKYLRNLNQILDNDFKYLDMLAVVLIKLQKFEEAITVYESMLKPDYSNIQIKKRIAGLYAKTGNLAKAQQILNESGLMN